MSRPMLRLDRSAYLPHDSRAGRHGRRFPTQCTSTKPNTFGEPDEVEDRIPICLEPAQSMIMKLRAPVGSSSTLPSHRSPVHYPGTRNKRPRAPLGQGNASCLPQPHAGASSQGLEGSIRLLVWTAIDVCDAAQPVEHLQRDVPALKIVFESVTVDRRKLSNRAHVSPFISHCPSGAGMTDPSR